MKKLISLCTAATLLTASLVTPVLADEFETTEYTIGICNYVDDASLNQIESNIQSELDALSIDGVTYDYASYTKNGQGDPTTINQIVADLMATEINNFVNDLGFSYRDAEEINGLRKIAKEFNLSCFEHIDVPRQETYTDEELTKMFDDFNENESTLTPSFALNYWQWVEYMTISFIGKGGAFNNYDRQANHLMGEIIKKIG